MLTILRSFKPATLQIVKFFANFVQGDVTKFSLAFKGLITMSFYKFNDVVHGEIILPNYVDQIIITPQFERLKNLKQLGKLGRRVDSEAKC
jgi:hypothetical protein